MVETKSDNGAPARAARDGSWAWRQVADRPIAVRINLIIALGVVGLLVITGLMMLTDSRIEKAFEDADAHAELNVETDAIHLLALESRRLEMDFLSHRDLEYRDLYETIYGELRVALQDLARRDIVRDVGGVIGQLEKLSSKQGTDFRALVSASENLGLNETEGLRGRLRKAAHAIEERLSALDRPDLLVDLLMLRRHEKDYMLRVDTKYVDRFEGGVGTLRQKLAGLSENELVDKLGDYDSAFHSYVDVWNGIATKTVNLAAISVEMEPLFENLVTFAEERHDKAASSLRATREGMETMVSTGVVLILVVFIGGGVLLTLSITRPLRELTKTMDDSGESDSIEVPCTDRGDQIGELARAFSVLIDRLGERTGLLQQAEVQLRDKVADYGKFIEDVAEGDLTSRLSVSGDGDLSRLGENLNGMTERLASMAQQIREASVSTVSTLEQVRSAITTQSAGASEQASAVSETTSTLEEIRATSQQTLEKSTLLSEAAERTRDEGEKGLKSVSQVVHGMQDIRSRVEAIAETILALSGQTQQIGEITEVVNKLAQQSKMLALNASIEAAKAGDAGKGFAVVAAEVRELSEQSEQSTAQVQQILQEIRHAADKAVMATEEGTKGVDRGIELAEQTGGAVRRLSEVIEESRTVGQQIVAAVRQEAAGIDQIAVAMGEINKVTHQFVTATEESGKATGNLANIANQLNDKVKVYRL